MSHRSAALRRDWRSSGIGYKRSFLQNKVNPAIAGLLEHDCRQQADAYLNDTGHCWNSLCADAGNAQNQFDQQRPFFLCPGGQW